MSKILIKESTFRKVLLEIFLNNSNLILEKPQDQQPDGDSNSNFDVQGQITNVNKDKSSILLKTLNKNDNSANDQKDKILYLINTLRYSYSREGVLRFDPGASIIDVFSDTLDEKMTNNQKQIWSKAYAVEQGLHFQRWLESFDITAGLLENKFSRTKPGILLKTAQAISSIIQLHNNMGFADTLSTYNTGKWFITPGLDKNKSYAIEKGSLDYEIYLYTFISIVDMISTYADIKGVVGWEYLNQIAKRDFLATKDRLFIGNVKNEKGEWEEKVIHGTDTPKTSKSTTQPMNYYSADSRDILTDAIDQAAADIDDRLARSKVVTDNDINRLQSIANTNPTNPQQISFKPDEVKAQLEKLKRKKESQNPVLEARFIDTKSHSQNILLYDEKGNATNFLNNINNDTIDAFFNFFDNRGFQDAEILNLISKRYEILTGNSLNVNDSNQFQYFITRCKNSKDTETLKNLNSSILSVFEIANQKPIRFNISSIDQIFSSEMKSNFKNKTLTINNQIVQRINSLNNNNQQNEANKILAFVRGLYQNPYDINLDINDIVSKEDVELINGLKNLLQVEYDLVYDQKIFNKFASNADNSIAFDFDPQNHIYTLVRSSNRLEQLVPDHLRELSEYLEENPDELQRYLFERKKARMSRVINENNTDRVNILFNILDSETAKGQYLTTQHKIFSKDLPDKTEKILKLMKNEKVLEVEKDSIINFYNIVNSLYSNYYVTIDLLSNPRVLTNKEYYQQLIDKNIINFPDEATKKQVINLLDNPDEQLDFSNPILRSLKDSVAGKSIYSKLLTKNDIETMAPGIRSFNSQILNTVNDIEKTLKFDRAVFLNKIEELQQFCNTTAEVVEAGKRIIPALQKELDAIPMNNFATAEQKAEREILAFQIESLQELNTDLAEAVNHTIQDSAVGRKGLSFTTEYNSTTGEAVNPKLSGQNLKIQKSWLTSANDLTSGVYNNANSLFDEIYQISIKLSTKFKDRKWRKILGSVLDVGEGKLKDDEGIFEYLLTRFFDSYKKENGAITNFINIFKELCLTPSLFKNNHYGTGTLAYSLIKSTTFYMLSTQLLGLGAGYAAIVALTVFVKTYVLGIGLRIIGRLLVGQSDVLYKLAISIAKRNIKSLTLMIKTITKYIDNVSDEYRAIMARVSNAGGDLDANQKTGEYLTDLSNKVESGTDNFITEAFSYFLGTDTDDLTFKKLNAFGEDNSDKTIANILNYAYRLYLNLPNPLEVAGMQGIYNDSNNSGAYNTFYGNNGYITWLKNQLGIKKDEYDVQYDNDTLQLSKAVFYHKMMQEIDRLGAPKKGMRDFESIQIDEEWKRSYNFSQYISHTLEDLFKIRYILKSKLKAMSKLTGYGAHGLDFDTMITGGYSQISFSPDGSDGSFNIQYKPLYSYNPSDNNNEKGYNKPWFQRTATVNGKQVNSFYFQVAAGYAATSNNGISGVIQPIFTHAFTVIADCVSFLETAKEIMQNTLDGIPSETNTNGVF